MPISAELQLIRLKVNEAKWMKRGACRGNPPDIWHPDDEDRNAQIAYRTARTICDACPVKEDCLEYALANNIDHGMWGGHTPRERRRIRRRRRRANRAG